MQRLKILTLAGLAVAILGSAAVGAQTANGALKGMVNPGLQIETLDSDNAACDITEARLVRAVKDGTADTPFKFNGYNYNLYIRISSLFRAGECFSSVDVAAYYQGRLPMPAYPGGAYSKVVLWESGTVLVSRREKHGREISVIVENLMRSMVVDWKRDNS